ncbi:hypothetical protein EPN83_01660 [Patescibacteria group bacterium]|nr:MAG: hypothetical protein EPN83_01660 [Patescibacteria group bacterium]
MGSDKEQNIKTENKLTLPGSIILSGLLIAGAIIYVYGGNGDGAASLPPEKITAESYVLPIKLRNLGERMVSAGVIDRKKFEELYRQSGRLSEAAKLLSQNEDAYVEINPENSDILLNFLWALGLGQKNKLLEENFFADKNTAGGLASTAGWTIARGDAMEHLGRHRFLPLTAEQESLVERLARTIYRPCCNNPAHLPDCNHGMAMLGLLELMSAQNVSEEEMYKAALAANSAWFPDTYRSLGEYFKSRGIRWETTSPKQILSATYSSASGYQKFKDQMNREPRGGSGCSV